MENKKFKRAATARRFVAVFFTLAFHIALIGGISYGSQNETSFDQYLPDTVKEWLGKDVPAKDEKTVAARP